MAYYVPQVIKKTEASKHRCAICEEQMAVGELTIYFLNNVHYGGSGRFVHVNCWLKKEGRLLIQTNIFKPKQLKKLRAEMFLEEV